MRRQILTRAGPARVSPAVDETRPRSDAASSIESGRRGGTFDTGIQRGAASASWRARTSCSASSATRTARRPGPRIASPTSSWRRASRSSCGAAFPTTTLLDLATRRTAERSGRARAAGPPDAGRSPIAARSSRTSPASGCSCATCATSQPNSDVFPDFDDNLRQAFRRETELLFESIIREDRSVLDLLTRRLHVRQRAAGAALRHPGHLRQPVPARGGHRRGAQGAARPGQHPGGDVARRAHVAGAARQVDSREPARHAAAAAARRRAAAQGNEEGREAADACGSGWSEHRANPGLRELPQGDGSDRVRARELRRGRRVAHATSPARRSMRRASWPTARTVDGVVALRKAILDRPELFVDDDDREAADLRARPRRRLPRHAGGSAIVREATPRRRTTAFRRIVLGIVEQRAVPDAREGRFRRDRIVGIASQRRS